MVDNVSATGSDRVDAQTADEAALTAVKGITPQIAKAIVSYRGQNQLKGVADLLDVVAAQNDNQTGGNMGANRSGNTRTQSTPNRSSQNQSGSTPSGPNVISEDLLMDIADELTTQSAQNADGLINVNTASLEVLACLSGVDRELAQAIISFRQSNGFFPNVAWLLKVPGMPRDTFKQLAARVCVRSETFCILSEGKVNSTGSRQRIQEIVHMGLHSVKTLAYREDDL
jgi:competence ComEA-like helix-hairpin-helix protein